MAFVSKETRKDGSYEAVIDVDVETGEHRIGIYRGDTLLAIEWFPSLDRVVDRCIARAKEAAPDFPFARSE